MNLAKRLTRMTLLPRMFFAAVLGSLAMTSARAEDIDIFSGNSLNTLPVNVLIIIDSSSNWSSSLNTSADCTARGWPGTKFGAEMCALQELLESLASSSSNLNIGLMMFTETGDNGAYVRFALRPMSGTSSEAAGNRAAMTQMIKAFVQSGTGTDNSGSNQPYGRAMIEAFKYFGGWTDQAHAQLPDPNGPGNPSGGRTGFAQGDTSSLAFAGGSSNNSGTFRRDYQNNNVASNRSGYYYVKQNNGSTQLYAFSSSNTDIYVPPITNPCQKNFIVFISNGNPSTGGDNNVQPAKVDPDMLKNLGVQQLCIPNCSNELHPSKMDELAKFLATTDVSALSGQQKVLTYTIGVYAPQSSGLPSTSDQQMLNLMASAAANGGGTTCNATSAAEVVKCLTNTLNSVQAANSVFVSASLPVSVNTQGTYLNQVYMGMFKPDANNSPRWLGNLKEYKIDIDSLGNLFLADSLDQQAVNAATGFLDPKTQSFWTTASTFWVNNQQGTPLSSSDLPDGEVIVKGGSAQQVRSVYATDQSTRPMYTCAAGTCAGGMTINTPFTYTNLSGLKAQFGSTLSDSDFQALILWIRGQDNVICVPGATGCTWSSAESGPGSPTTVRPSVHGDVLHSRPVVLNYPNIGPYLFYGGNDGVLRGIKGGRLTTDGREQWSFIAPEFYGKYLRQRSQQPNLVLPTVIGSANVKDYFFDGPIGSYQNGSTAWIYVTARRGGRVLYALDVSQPDQPPKILWKKTNADLPRLGQTWSEPKVFKVKALSDPVVMFGAGYDPAEDLTPVGTRTMGDGVYVLNARTGDLVTFFQTSVNGDTLSGTASVPSDVMPVDRDFDTFVDKAYVGDTKGRVWRMDIDDLSTSNWHMEKVADLGNFKFFFRPDVILTKNFDILLLGSGDREKPLVQSSTDMFFSLHDVATGKDGSQLVPIGFGNLAQAGTANAATLGYYLQLQPGEKVVNAPLSIGGVTYFSTNQPTPPAQNSCLANLGTARAYAVDFLSGGAGIDRNGDGQKNSSDLFTTLTGGGLPPSPVGGVVQLDNGQLVDFVIGSGSGAGPDAGSAIGVGHPIIQIPKTRKKLYWNTSTDK